MKLFEQMLKLPGAAAALTRILINHVITEVALDRVNDETLAKAALYNAVFESTNADHCNPAAMYETMFENAPQGDSIMNRMRVTDDQWEAFGGKNPKLGMRQLKNSFNKVAELLKGETDINAWKKLSEFTQHELAVSVERSLISAAERYADWVAERPTSINMRRAENTDAALAVIPDLITEYEADPKVAKAIEKAIESGAKANIRENVAA